MADPVSVAIGGQHRTTRLRATPDSLDAAGETSAADPEFVQTGTEEVDAFFTEFSIPVLNNLEVQLAARTEDYGSAVLPIQN